MTTDEAREVLEKHKEWVLKFNHGMATAESKALEVAIEALEQPAPFQSMDFDDIADEIESELVRYATEESEYWHHWRIGVMDGLKKAQSMMSAPVYHYLPEVPKGTELVIAYCDQYDRGFVSQFLEGGWYDVEDSSYSPTPYAWTRIPPKPPVNPMEEQP